MITLADFSYILTGLNAASITMSNVILSSKSSSEQPAGESGQRNLELETETHIAGVWSDEADHTSSTLTWYIGVVEAVDKSGAMVSYMVEKNDKSNWMYSEISATCYTPR